MITTKKEFNRIKLYLTALSFLDSDASPLDEAPDDLGCADSVTQVILKAFPKCIKGSIGTSELYKQLKLSKDFIKVLDIRCGDIIISPTGMGKNTKVMPHGHVGIVGENEEVMSNSSSLGLWKTNHTITSWVKKYRNIGKYPIYIFRKV